MTCVGMWWMGSSGCGLVSGVRCGGYNVTDKVKWDVMDEAEMDWMGFDR